MHLFVWALVADYSRVNTPSAGNRQTAREPHYSRVNSRTGSSLFILLQSLLKVPGQGLFDFFLRRLGQLGVELRPKGNLHAVATRGDLVQGPAPDFDGLRLDRGALLACPRSHTNQSTQNLFGPPARRLSGYLDGQVLHGLAPILERCIDALGPTQADNPRVTKRTDDELG